ncbi:MAG: tetratricopeptide repeat protein, partial [Acidobacteriota bacterium]
MTATSTRTSTRRKTALLGVFLGLWALLPAGLPGGGPAATPGADEVPELLPVPAPDLAEADPSIREQLAEHREALDRALAVSGEGGGAGEPPPGAPEDAGAAAPEGLAALFGRMGQLYFLYGYDDAARAAFENARRLAPDDLRWPYYLGVLHERRGELEAAARELESVLDQRPEDVPALLHLASVALEANRLDDAEAHYRAALEAGAGAAAHYGLGRIALERGEPERAAELLEGVLEEHPDSGPVHYQLGLAYRQLGELDRAREH